MKFNYGGITYELILLTLAGSRFYGTHYDATDVERQHPFDKNYTSDHDWRGIFVAHPNSKIGLAPDRTEIQTTGTDDDVTLAKLLSSVTGQNISPSGDLVLYEVKKFTTLALEANPNIMDVIFADSSAVVYSNQKGKDLMDIGKSVFLSLKTRDTFSGYAMSQIRRVKNHNKFINVWPDSARVLNAVTLAFKEGNIDKNWILDHFGGDVAGAVVTEGVTTEQFKNLSWNEWVEKYISPYIDDLERYRKPQLIDYCAVKDLKAKRLSLDLPMHDLVEPGITVSQTLHEFLINEASWRSISKTQLNIFTTQPPGSKGGIFTRAGTLKTNDPAEVGTFVCQMSVDDCGYKKDYDAVAGMWSWRVNRNQARGLLEEKFGYDVKHASHTIRLLLGGANIMCLGDYKPRLEGEDLELVRSILRGEKSYDEVLNLAISLENGLKQAAETSSLPINPDHTKANELLLRLSVWTE